jgi:hypothetical protein
MSGFVLLGYFVSAIAALVLSGWLFTHRERLGVASGATATALVVTAMWSVSVVADARATMAADLLFGLAGLSWLWALYRLFAQDGRHATLAPIRPVVVAVGFVGLLQLALLFAAAGSHGSDTGALLRVEMAFRLLFCVGALVLVHNLYVGASSPNRETLRWPAAALGLLWVYELNYDTIAYLSDGVPVVLKGLRGWMPFAMVCLL